MARNRVFELCLVLFVNTAIFLVCINFARQTSGETSAVAGKEAKSVPCVSKENRSRSERFGVFLEIRERRINDENEIKNHYSV